MLRTGSEVLFPLLNNIPISNIRITMHPHLAMRMKKTCVYPRMRIIGPSLLSMLINTQINMGEVHEFMLNMGDNFPAHLITRDTLHVNKHSDKHGRSA